jgi:hypothetical protein
MPSENDPPPASPNTAAAATSPSTAKTDIMRGRKYKVGDFVADAAALRITPFMLDSYAREYDDMCRARDAHAIEVDELRTQNRALQVQAKSLEESLAQINAEHVELLVRFLAPFFLTKPPLKHVSPERACAFATKKRGDRG